MMQVVILDEMISRGPETRGKHGVGDGDTPDLIDMLHSGRYPSF